MQSQSKELVLGSKAGLVVLSMQREQSPMPRGMTETNAHWLQEGAICFSGICCWAFITDLTRAATKAFPDSKGEMFGITFALCVVLDRSIV